MFCNLLAFSYARWECTALHLPHSLYVGKGEHGQCMGADYIGSCPELGVIANRAKLSATPAALCTHPAALADLCKLQKKVQAPHNSFMSIGPNKHACALHKMSLEA